jgi:hypothetical protein
MLVVYKMFQVLINTTLTFSFNFLLCMDLTLSTITIHLKMLNLVH